MTTTKEIIKALKISDINVEEITIGSNVKEITIGTKKTNKTVPITFKNKSIVFQTPFLEIIGNLRKTPYNNIYQLDTLFRGDNKQKNHQWYQFIENLETHVSNQVVSNGSKWFSQKNIIIKSLIRELDPEKGIFFVKWPIDLKTNIFVDESKKLFDPMTLKERDLVKLIVEISDLWINENQCGLAIVVQKILVKPYLEKIQSEYIFDDIESENSEENERENNIISLLATEQKTRPVSKQNNQEKISQQTHQTQQNQSQLLNQQKQDNHIQKKQNPQSKSTPSTNPVIEFEDTKNVKQKTKNETNNKNDNQAKETIQKQNKLINDPKEISNKISFNDNSKNKKQYEQPSKKFFNKESVNPFQKKQMSSFKEVYSDLSDDGELSLEDDMNNQNNNMMNQIVQQYSPSSDEMAEINEEDLDFN
jgi:hypothetical protein